MSARPRRRLLVERIGPGATVQDGGRFHARKWAVPVSGPLDRATMRAAIEAVSSDPGDAAIELPRHPAVFRALDALTISIDGAPARRLAAGEQLRVDTGASAVRYLAVDGGVDVPVVLGSRSTCLPASFGGFGGRMLRAADELLLRDPSASSSTASSSPREIAREFELAVTPTLGFERFYRALLSRAFTVDARSNRVGTRLSAEPLTDVPPSLATSRPMVRGAVQLPSDGLPIVLGPDGPTIGGYPVIAVLTERASDALARLWPGERIQFVDARTR